MNKLSGLIKGFLIRKKYNPLIRKILDDKKYVNVIFNS